MNINVLEEALGVSSVVNDGDHWVEQAIEPMRLGFNGYDNNFMYVGVGYISSVANAVRDKLSPATIKACDQLMISMFAGLNTVVVVVNEFASVHMIRQLYTLSNQNQLMVQDKYGTLRQDGYISPDEVNMFIVQNQPLTGYSGLLEPLPLPRRIVDELEDALSQQVTLALATARLVGDQQER